MSFLSKPNEFLGQVSLGQNSFFRHLLSIIILVFDILIIAGIPFFLLTIYLDHDKNPHSYVNFNNIAQPFVGCPSWILLLAVFFSFAIVALGIFFVVKLIHERPILSLINHLPSSNNKFRISRFCLGLTVWGILISIATFIQFLLFRESFSMNNINMSLVYSVLVALFAITVQASTEELFFRGYLQQFLALFTSRRWLIILISSIAFTIAHIANPELDLTKNISEKIFTIGSYLGFAVFAGILAVKDKGIELSMGLHTANNLFLATICGYKNSALPVDTIFYINSNPSALFDLTSFIILAIIFYYFVFCFRKK